MKRSVPILLYHHISPEREITPMGFEVQLRSLLDEGYEALSMNDLALVISGKKLVTKPSFVVTFDDGYRDNVEHAFPVLQKLAIPAMIYLVTEKIGSDGFLSWADIKAMAATGLVSYGSHTHTHRHFIRHEPYQNLEEELSKSKALIEQELNVPCEHLAWPWGDYEDEWLPLVKKLGYATAATTLSGSNAEGTDPYELRRINIRRPDADKLLSRLKWNAYSAQASAFGLFYGWDRRFKVWWNKESPYSHG